VPSNQQRREAAKRKLQRQLVRRQQRAVAQRRRLMIVGVVAAVLVIAGGVWLFSSIGGNNTASGDTSASSTTSSAPASSTAPATPCSYPVGGTAAKDVDPPTNLSPANTGTVNATVTLNTGTLTFQLDRANAPCAVESFLSLASQKYFDDTPCHRLTTASTLKVLQCGDPTGKGTGGPGYTFGDELTGNEKYTEGTLAMANGGADTNGSQFFIVYGDSQLQANYTVLGKVTKGLDVVKAIAKKGVKGGGQDGAPAEKVTIKTVTIPSGSVKATGDYQTTTGGATETGSAVATGSAPDTGSAAPDTASSTGAGSAGSSADGSASASDATTAAAQSTDSAATSG